MYETVARPKNGYPFTMSVEAMAPIIVGAVLLFAAGMKTWQFVRSPIVPSGT